MLSRFFDTILTYPKWVCFITLVVTLICVLGLGGLSSSNDYRAFLDDDYPGMLELAEVESRFAENKVGSVFVQPNEGSIFTPEGLALLRELTEELWSVSRIKRVDSLTNFQFTKAIGDDLYVQDLVPLDSALGEAEIALAREVALSDPAIVDLMVSRDESVAAIVLTFDFSGADSLDATQRDMVAEEILAVMARHQSEPSDFKIIESGMFFGDYYSDRYLNEINELLMPVMLLVMMVLLTILLRSFSGLIAATIVVVGSGVITMGILGWAGMLLEAVAAMGPIVIMTLAVADSVHIIVGAQAALGRGMDKAAAIKESLRINFMPVFLTSLTTALGVITFVFTDFPSLRKLGVIIAIGVSVAFILSVTILPVLLRWMPLKPRSPDSAGQEFFTVLASFSMRNAKLILPVALIASLVLSFGITRGVVDESFQNLFKPHTDIAKSIKVADEKLAGLLQLDVAVFGNQPNEVITPTFLKTLDDFKQWALDQENVTHVQTVSDTFKRLNKSMHGDDESWYRLPDNRELAAQYLLLYEMSLPVGLDLSTQISLDKSATRLAVSATNVEGANVLRLQRSIRKWFADNAPQYRVIATGLVPLMSEVTTEQLAPKMARGGIIAVMMVSLVLFFALRSWLLGTLGMLANVIPIAVGYGLWALSGQIYNFVVISVAGICLGMVVDFAVHFIDKFRHSFQQGRGVEASIHYAFEKVAGPITITAAVLMAGFFVLSFTNTATFDGLGLLTPIIILLALTFDLLVLPALLYLFYGRRANTVAPAQQ